MITTGFVKKGEYYDSVTLMRAAKKLNEMSGVLDSAIVMGTAENKAILAASGLMMEDFRTSADADLLIAANVENEQTAKTLPVTVENLLKSTNHPASSDSAPLLRTLEAALRVLPDANLAMISVAGRYAGPLAMKALQRGLHVMLFSDNVPLELEIAFKKYAVEHGLLVMGPDCGTAIINGVPLAFANVVKRGDIGIVAAAGTGLQEVSSLISNYGAGISQAIGTGGRDVKQQVGGLMFLEGLRLLDEDPHTKFIVLISKPPHADVLKKIVARTKAVRKPVVACFLGIEATAIEHGGMIFARTLADAAQIAVALSHGEDLTKSEGSARQRLSEIESLAQTEATKLDSAQKFLRGLFSGGTFCYEGQVLLGDLLKSLHSNAPTGTTQRVRDLLVSEGHTVLDLGEDEFTVGRPHPMIDFSLRNKRIIHEAEDPQTAVMLLDIVLGHGSHSDPLSEIVPAIRRAQQIANDHHRHLPVVCSVTGTDQDPQNRSVVAKGLTDCGVRVSESNAAACLLAGHIAARAGS